MKTEEATLDDEPIEIPEKKSLLRTISAEQINESRYGSFNPLSHARSLSVEILKNECSPWDEEHANLEDQRVRQSALEFNLGVMWGACLSITINMWLGSAQVVPFGTMGAFLAGAVMAVAKFTVKSSEIERAEYEYIVERKHLQTYPNEEQEELRESLVEWGFDHSTVTVIINDLSCKKDLQAELHTMFHLGIARPHHQSSSFMPYIVTFFSVTFGVLFSLFPYLFIPNGFRASIGCIFMLCMLSLASGALLSLKSLGSASYYALRQAFIVMGTSAVLVGISWIINIYHVEWCDPGVVI